MISNIISSALLAATLLSQTTAGSSFDASASNHLALYWGQNSAGSQGSLASYCQKQEADIILLSFLYEYPSSIGLNFANACATSFSDGLLDCATIAEDIVTCQDLGVKVLLSLGGASGAYGFTSDDEATTFATTLWDYFGEGSATERPFGDSVVDGFDFDIENNSNVGYTALVSELRSIFDKSGSKDYYISAAPQCVYPDAGVGDLLLNGDVDFAFVQFYNNYCNLGSSNFNWDTWKNFAENDSYNKDIKIFLGLPGSASAAGSGYQSDLSVVESAVSTMSESSHFGGIMLWDASQAYANSVDGNSYASDMKSIVDEYASSSTTSTSSSTTSTSSSTTSTSSSTTSTSSSTTSTSSSTTATSSSTTETSSSTTKTSSSSALTTASSTSASRTTTTLIPASSLTHSTATVTSTTSSVSANSQTSSRATTTLAPSSTTRNWDEPLTTETITLANGAVTTSHIWWLPETTTTNSWEQPLTTQTVTLSNGEVVTSHIWWLPESTSSSSAATSAATPTSTTVVSTTATTSSSQTASSTTQTASSTVTNSALTSAIALNKEYESGLPSTCSNGDMACDAEGKFALCGADSAWTTFECASGTSCFAYTQSDEVLIGCNWSYAKPSFV